MTAINELVAECRRQEESCRYSSAALHVWAKYAKVWRWAFLIAPIILGGVAGSQLFADADGGWKLAAIFCSLAAGFFPSIHLALNMDMNLFEISRSAGEFTNLRDRFRIAANIKSKGTPEEFQAEFEALLDRMDAVRIAAPSVPEWAFRAAQRKILKGDFHFDSDAAKAKKK